MGGNIFKGRTAGIPKEYIEPTLEKYYEELINLFPKKREAIQKFEPVGSVGKKAVSGDIDIAIDAKEFFTNGEVTPEELSAWNVDPVQWEKTYLLLKKRARTSTDYMIRWKAFLKEIASYINENSDLIDVAEKKTTTGNIFTIIEQYNEESEEQGIGVQIDWMVGSIDWLRFSYYSDPPVENVKGLHRTQLILSMFSAKGYAFSHVHGVKDKETKETVARTSEDAIKLLGKLYGEAVSNQELQNYITLHNYLKRSSNPEEYSEVLDTYLRILDYTRADIPWDMQDYWIQNKDRLNLTGRYLPDDSKLKQYI